MSGTLLAAAPRYVVRCWVEVPLYPPGDDRCSGCDGESCWRYGTHTLTQSGFKDDSCHLAQSQARRDGRTDR